MVFKPVGVDENGKFAPRVAANIMGMPEAYIDARTLPSGPVTSLTKGQFVGSYGNSPAVVSNGAIEHTPVGGANTASYIEAMLSDEVMRIGALVEWPTGAAVGSIALVIPNESWTSGDGTATNIGTAGVHVVVSSLGNVTQARYEGATVNAISNRTPAALQGGRHVVEVLLDPRTKIIRAYVDGALLVEKQDTTAFDMLSNRAIWELYETTGSSATPAKFLATWADVEKRVPSSAPFAGSKHVPVAVANAYSSAATYVKGTSTSDTISADLNTTTVTIPISGRVLASVSAWVDGTAATNSILASINGQGSHRIAGAGFKGRLKWDVVVTGTPGSVITIQPTVWTLAGNVTIETGGSVGTLVVSAIPL